MVFWALAFTAYLVRCTTDHVVLLARRTLLAKAIGSARCFVRWLFVSVDKVSSRTLVDVKGKNAAKNARRKARKRVAKLQARGCCIYIPKPPVDLLASPQSEKATSHSSHTPQANFTNQKAPQPQEKHSEQARTHEPAAEMKETSMIATVATRQKMKRAKLVRRTTSKPVGPNLFLRPGPCPFRVLSLSMHVTPVPSRRPRTARDAPFDLPLCQRSLRLQKPYDRQLCLWLHT